mgnify:CR=1 FL=1
MANLYIPTDLDITKAMGGIPVISCRPEDLPHFRAGMFDKNERWELEGRAKALIDTWVNFCPALSQHDALEEHAIYVCYIKVCTHDNV